ncbi:hypothetical protein I552_4731 [Mycobacterium xenopi 3993]|nr:hypothetical protein I552_4731 [Mycobacterium xenopi 3993]
MVSGRRRPAKPASIGAIFRRGLVPASVTSHGGVRVSAVLPR